MKVVWVNSMWVAVGSVARVKVVMPSVDELGLMFVDEFFELVEFVFSKSSIFCEFDRV